MKQIIFFLLLTSYINIHAQKIYEVEDFSNKYTAKVYCDESKYNSEEYYYPVEIKVFDKLTKEEVVTVIRVSNIDFERLEGLEEGEKIKANINDFPYGETSIIIAGDFNCDGLEDLAIQTSNYWKDYPSYAFYLNVNGVLVEDEKWTIPLIGEGCGIFRYNCETKILETYCGIRHQSETESRYSIEDGTPILIEQKVTMLSEKEFPNCYITTWTAAGYEEKEILFDDYLDILFRIKIADIDRELILFYSLDDLFLYVIDTNGVIDDQLLGIGARLGKFSLTKTEKAYSLLFELDTPIFEIIWTDSEINIHTLGEGNERIYKGIYLKEGIPMNEILNAQFDNLIK